MIRHIVMWTLRDATHATRFKTLLDSCANLVPGTHQFEVGIKSAGLDANADVVLVSLFSDVAALDAYQNHSHHKAVSAELGPMRESRHILDYVIE